MLEPGHIKHWISAELACSHIEVEGDGHGEEEVHLVHQELVTADFS